MNLIDHNPHDTFEVFPHPFTRKNCLQGLGGSHLLKERRFCLRGASARSGIPVPNLHFDVQFPPNIRKPTDNVPVQRSQRSDIEYRDTFRFTSRPTLNEHVEDREDASKRFSSASRGDHENVSTLKYRRYSDLLYVTRLF